MKLDAFLKRIGYTKADLCRYLGLDSKSSVVAHYISGRSYPPIDKIEKLIKLGMNGEEFLGEELFKILIKNSLIELCIQDLSDEDCRLIVERGILQLKNKRP